MNTNSFQLRHIGPRAKEQETMFIEDPNGNCMEIKTMKNPESLFNGIK